MCILYYSMEYNDVSGPPISVVPFFCSSY
jgi:hypothetical protein